MFCNVIWNCMASYFIESGWIHSRSVCVFIPPENIRKSLDFKYFQGKYNNTKETLAWIGLSRTLNSKNYLVVFWTFLILCIVLIPLKRSLLGMSWSLFWTLCTVFPKRTFFLFYLQYFFSSFLQIFSYLLTDHM